MKYTFLVAALFAFSLNLHAQSDPQKSEGDAAEPSAAQPAASESTEVMEATDQKGETKETITGNQEKVTDTPAQPKAKAPAADASGKPAKAIVTQDLKGEIQKIDIESRTLVIADKTFKFWQTGKVFFKRKLKSLADLKVGDKVAITYREAKDGTLEASRINK